MSCATLPSVYCTKRLLFWVTRWCALSNVNPDDQQCVVQSYTTCHAVQSVADALTVNVVGRLVLQLAAMVHATAYSLNSLQPSHRHAFTLPSCNLAVQLHKWLTPCKQLTATHSFSAAHTDALKGIGHAYPCTLAASLTSTTSTTITTHT